MWLDLKLRCPPCWLAIASIAVEPSGETEVEVTPALVVVAVGNVLSVGQAVDQDGPLIDHRGNRPQQRLLHGRRHAGCRNRCLAAGGDRLEPGARTAAGWRDEDKSRVRRLDDLGQALLRRELCLPEALELALGPLELGVHSVRLVGEALDESRLRRDLLGVKGLGSPA